MSFSSAKHFTQRLLKNIYMDLRHGGKFLGGNVVVLSEFAQKGYYYTESTEYTDLEFIFKVKYQVQPNDILVDIGCGKGRVLNSWLHLGLKNKLYGIEVNPSLALMNEKRLKKYKQIKILCGDAVALIPKDGTVFYLYNPFAQEVVEQFLKNVHQLSETVKRPLYVIYLHCIYMNSIDPKKWNILETFRAPSFNNECCIAVTRP